MYIHTDKCSKSIKIKQFPHTSNLKKTNTIALGQGLKGVSAMLGDITSVGI